MKHDNTNEPQKAIIRIEKNAWIVVFPFDGANDSRIIGFSKYEGHFSCTWHYLRYQTRPPKAWERDLVLTALQGTIYEDLEIVDRKLPSFDWMVKNERRG